MTGLSLLWRILAGEFAEGDTALVDYSDGEYTFAKAKEGREPAQAGAKAR